MIELIDFVKNYGRFRAVDCLNLQIPAGELFGFIGPNGAGKTTTIRFLATLIKASSGDGRVAGFSVSRQPLEVRHHIGYMPDQFGSYNGMRVGEFLDFFGQVYLLPRTVRRRRIEMLLETLDLKEKAKARVTALSRGMKQKLYLARTLIHDPPVLILDEPAAGLDPQARIELKHLLKSLRRQGKTILVSSHILSELADFCSWVGIIYRGRLLTCGPIEDVLRSIRVTRHIMVRFRDQGDGLGLARRIVGQRPDVNHLYEDEGGLSFDLQGDDAEAAELLRELIQSGVEVTSFTECDPTLEDVFLRLTQTSPPRTRGMLIASDLKKTTYVNEEP